jgi:hypothetical protein
MNSIKNWIIISLTIIITAIIVVVGFGNNPSKPEVIKSDPVINNSSSYIKALRDAFMTGCLEGDDNFDYYEYCDCAWDYLDSVMTDGQLIEWVENYDGEMTDEMLSATLHCSHLVR